MGGTRRSEKPPAMLSKLFMGRRVPFVGLDELIEPCWGEVSEWLRSLLHQMSLIRDWVLIFVFERVGQRVGGGGQEEVYGGLPSNGRRRRVCMSLSRNETARLGAVGISTASTPLGWA